MSIFPKLARLLGSENNGDTLSEFTWKISGDGLDFVTPRGFDAVRTLSSLASLQAIALRMLLESGLAEESPSEDVFAHVPGDVLCDLGEDDRELLRLPGSWSGGLKLETRSVTSRPDFSMTLRPVPARGAARTRTPVVMDGPFLVYEGRQYLPSAAQWAAITAVADHAKLSPEERSEEANLLAVRRLQVASEKADVDLGHFAGLRVTVPDRVGLAATEVRGGGLVLAPDLEDVDPDALVRLPSSTGPVVRVGDRIIVLDETRLAAVREILGSRLVSPDDRDQFLETPGAFLDSTLVDLDTGFSFRVRGATRFVRASFGPVRGSGIDWFGNTEFDHVLWLRNTGAVAALFESEEDFERFRARVEAALSEGSPNVRMGDLMVVLPDSALETRALLESVARTLRAKLLKLAKEAVEKPEEKESVALDIAESEETEKVADTSFEEEIDLSNLKLAPLAHQKEGIAWLLGLMPGEGRPAVDGRVYRGGLLADDMGLGKTYQVLAALDIHLRRCRGKGHPVKPVLAVMPVVLLENWKREIDKIFVRSPFTGDADVVVLQASADLPRFRLRGRGRETVPGQKRPDDRAVIRYSLKVGPDYGRERLDMPGRLVLTNYDTLRDYQFSLCRVDWGCVVFDEAQDIRNPNTLKAQAAKGLKADFRLAMTGTPVENGLVDFWNIFDTVKPGLLGTRHAFRKAYVEPVEEVRGTSGEGMRRQEVGRQIRNRVGGFMLRRTKEEHLRGLPKKFEHNGLEDARYLATMSGRQLDTYNTVVTRVVEARRQRDIPALRQLLLPSLQALRTISIHPDFVSGGKPSLPENSRECEEFFAASAKLLLLRNILEEVRARDEKVIVFLMNKALQAHLACTMNRLFGLDVSVVNGDTATTTSANARARQSRMGLIGRFQEREGFNVIIMSPLAAGVGLTITGASNVVHLERAWNPAKEAQATDRVYRIGAKRDVHVYVPILDHPDLLSFDRNQADLLLRKTALKDAVIAPAPLEVTDFNLDGMFGVNMDVG